MDDLIRLFVALAGLGAGSWTAVAAFRLRHRPVIVEGVAGRPRRMWAGWITEVSYTDSAGRRCTGSIVGRQHAGDIVPLRYSDVWRHRSLAPGAATWPYAEPACLLVATVLTVGLTYLL